MRDLQHFKIRDIIAKMPLKTIFWHCLHFSHLFNDPYHKFLVAPMLKAMCCQHQGCTRSTSAFSTGACNTSAYSTGATSTSSSSTFANSNGIFSTSATWTGHAFSTSATSNVFQASVL